VGSGGKTLSDGGAGFLSRRAAFEKSVAANLDCDRVQIVKDIKSKKGDKLHEPRPFVDQELHKPKTPNEWFVQRYKSAYEKFGSPFLELHDPYANEVHVISMNQDF
jgi:hypothetical protein